MSRFVAPVVEYISEPHPNADALELAAVDGWRVVCRIGDFTDGQKVAYIPEGSLVPWDLVVELGLADPPRLSGKDFNRVKAVRLRGIVSQGLIYGGSRIDCLSVGDDAVEALGLVKYVPEVPEEMRGIMVPGGPMIRYEIDNVKAWPERMIDDEDCVVTEKLHGVFCCVGVYRESPVDHVEPVVSSRGPLAKGLKFVVEADENTDNIYVDVWRAYGDAIMQEFARHDGINSLLCFGETYGRGIQDLHYGTDTKEFRMFDLRIGGEYADWDIMAAAAERIGIPTVPLLYRGPWHNDLLEQHTTGGSTIADHHREGVVVRPAVERLDTGLDHPSGLGPGRPIFKSISDKHLLRKGGTEYN